MIETSVPSTAREEIVAAYQPVPGPSVKEGPDAARFRERFQSSGFPLPAYAPRRVVKSSGASGRSPGWRGNILDH